LVGIQSPWNPIENDGDALRLAVELKLDIVFHCDDNGCYAGTRDRVHGAAVYYDKVPDKNAAVRLAITQAAAEIGKSMP
jgi:hypothetical protein